MTPSQNENDMLAFLEACYDEDEQAALGAKGETHGRWEDDGDPAERIVLYGKDGKLTLGQARHIARHDPARVLREIDAKRRIVKRYAWLREHGDTGGTAWVLPLLALPYADRPGYREEWAV